MIFKKSLVVIFFALQLLCAKAQENYNILPWKGYTSLNTWLIQQVHQQYELRDSLIKKALTSKERFEEYRVACKKRYLTILGDLPTKTPLNSNILGVINEKDYRIEKVVFESSPKHHVTASLYLPNKTGVYPAVLFLCGHESTAKATESYQKTAQLFVKNGFVVMMIDPISQGERYQILDSLGKPATRGGTTEHTLLNAGANLVGTSVAAYELWDNIRSIDYLESRPEVDKNRIGCIGNSGGGTQTTYLMAFDERIKIAAPCSYVANRERNLELFGASDGCQHIPFEGREMLEIEDFLIAAAPKPLLILAGKFDFVDFNGVKQVEKDLKQVYSLYKKPNNFKLFSWDDGHGISKPKREEAITFFRTFFCNDNSRIIEQESDVLDENLLKCTVTGQVVSSYKDEKTVQGLNLEMANKLKASRDSFARLNEQIRIERISQLIGYTNEKLSITSEIVQSKEYDLFVLQKVIIRPKNEIPIPFLVYYPKTNHQPAEVEIILNEDGKDKIASSEMVLEMIKSGKIVVIPDLRGMGETFDKSEQNDPKYWNKEYRNAMISLHIGKTLTGQRVTDLKATVQYFISKYENTNISISIKAKGIYGSIALYAGLFEPSIKSINILNAISSYYDLLENPLMKNAYSYVIPSVLKYYDLPDIIKWVGPKKIVYTKQ